jgi:hypothetical protein
VEAATVVTKIYTQSHEAGQDDVYTSNWRGQLYSGKGILSHQSTVLQEENDAKIRDRDKTLGNVPYIHKNLPTIQGSSHKPQCTMSLQIYRKQWKTGSYTSDFLGIEGPLIALHLT